MIVSASYKTDIPAFYGAWFLGRLEAGFCRMVNPWGGQIIDVPLDRRAVDGFVFWTRNLRPFLPALATVRGRAPFVVQLTITGYPRPLESAVVRPAHALRDAERLIRAHGPRTLVWRYDPILMTSLTPPEWHEANFARLAASLDGLCDEVVFSFAHIYRKTQRNLAIAARRFAFTWADPPADEKRALLARLAQTATAHGMRPTLCAQPDLLLPDILMSDLGAKGVAPARCIDADRLSDVAAAFGQPAVVAMARGNRPGCLCAASRDIGHYDTCPHGCVYCYAVGSHTVAKRRRASHDPTSAFLFPPGRAA